MKRAVLFGTCVGLLAVVTYPKWVLPVRRLSVNFGVHFPVPFTGVCVCGLPLRLLSSWFWFDGAQFKFATEGWNMHDALLRHRWYGR